MNLIPLSSLLTVALFTIHVITASEILSAQAHNDVISILQESTASPIGHSPVTSSKAPARTQIDANVTATSTSAPALINNQSVPALLASTTGKPPLLDIKKPSSLPSTTKKPTISAGSSGLPTTVKMTVTGMAISGAKDENHGNTGLANKFIQYLKPICDSLDKIMPKQMFRIQSQFKQFVQLVSLNRILSHLLDNLPIC